MPSCNRREFLTRAGLIRPPMISEAQKARFIAATIGEITGHDLDPWPKVNVAHMAVLAWVIVSAIAIVVLS